MRRAFGCRAVGRLAREAADSCAGLWRQKVATDATLAQLVFDRKCTPEEMLAEIKSYTGRPYLKFRRPEGSLKEAQANLQETWQKVCGQLEDLEKAFWTILPKLNGQTYKRNIFENVFIDLKTNAESSHLPRLSKQTLGKLSLFSIDTLNSKLKKEYKNRAFDRDIDFDFASQYVFDSFDFGLGKGRYHLFNTCNTWLNDKLVESGLKGVYWTPFSSPLLEQYR